MKKLLLVVLIVLAAFLTMGCSHAHIERVTEAHDCVGVGC